MSRALKTASGEHIRSKKMLQWIRQLRDQLPRSHPAHEWRGGAHTDSAASDVELVDDFLQAHYNDYTVNDLVALTKSAGLQITGFASPGLYDPLQYNLTNPAVVSVVNKMTWLEKAAFAEHMAVSIPKHTFFVVKEDNDIVIPTKVTADCIPTLRINCKAELAANIIARESGVASNGILKIPLNYVGVQHSFGFNFSDAHFAGKLIPLMNGKHTVQEIMALMPHSSKCQASKDIMLEQINTVAQSLLSMAHLSITYTKKSDKLPINEEKSAHCSWMRYFLDS